MGHEREDGHTAKIGATVKPFSKELTYRGLRVAKPADFWQDRRTFWNQVGPQCGSPVHLSFPESSRRAMLRDRHWRRAARQRGSSAPGGRALPSVGLGKSPAQSACVRAGGLRRCAPFKSWPRVACARLCERRRTARQGGKRAPARGQSRLCDSGDNSWPLGSNGTCTVALTERLDHMK